MKIKPRLTKLAATPQTPPYPQLHNPRRPAAPVVLADSKPAKRDKTFSKSRDTREDRGERQIKTSHNPQTFRLGR
jgi:hypothetical protein